jgi:hypothetical protein
MHECQKLDLFDLDTKLMTSVGPVYKQQETSSRYCVANENLCNVRPYCKLLMLQYKHVSTEVFELVMCNASLLQLSSNRKAFA